MWGVFSFGAGGGAGAGGGFAGYEPAGHGAGAGPCPGDRVMGEGVFVAPHEGRVGIGSAGHTHTAR